MLLESHLKDNSIVVFDCESVAIIDKGGQSVRGHPDKVLPAMATMIRGIAREIRDATRSDDGPAPAMEVRFVMKIDSNGVVSVSRSESDGHLQVILRF